MKVAAAVSELEKGEDYTDKAEFVILTEGKDETYDAEHGKYDFGSAGHGLVVLDSEGTMLQKLDGHQFGKDEISEAINTAMGG